MNQESGSDPSAQDTAADGQAAAAAPDVAAPPITIRALIVTQDASIIIGKAGSHIKEIREKAGAKVSVSEQIPGNPERILHVTGPLDAVSKVCRKRHYWSTF
jgi:poly(rC)-binding protein 2/3/4